ncbi:CLUMA_CG007061, isoform A [Clunio marinus]|uniref:CLUMA_CG007061, isoform A n=1 Tax=Clunio marinus TaxID=568069 RepID=A0A1J1HZJ9_9DIPT|nr:CLUMA_CG007061, isoform A [Clunio marinus]
MKHVLEHRRINNINNNILFPRALRLQQHQTNRERNSQIISRNEMLSHKVKIFANLLKSLSIAHKELIQLPRRDYQIC